MNLIRHLKQISQETVLTIGNFDGFHLGHKEIIESVKKIAKEKNLTSAILTFEPHTARFFKPETAEGFRLTSVAQKIKIFKNEEIDNLIILPFNKKTAEISAEDFVKDILVDKLNVKYLVIGHDFIFGKDRKGNIEFLKKAGQIYGFEVLEIKAFKKNDEIFSSTLARKLVKEGNVKKTAEILGRNFEISGIVVKGRELARTFDYATANIKPKNQIIKPKFGVYKVEVYIPHLKKNFKGIMNFGLRPTVTDSVEPVYETHIFDFEGNLYNKKLHISLIDFVREELKFSSLDELKKQIIMDINSIR